MRPTLVLEQLQQLQLELQLEQLQQLLDNRTRSSPEGQPEGRDRAAVYGLVVLLVLIEQQQQQQQQRRRLEEAGRVPCHGTKTTTGSASRRMGAIARIAPGPRSGG